MHFFGVLGYGALAAAGAEFGLGSVFISLLAVMLLALLIAVLKNILWVVAAAIVGSIPILGWVVVIYFLVVRWEFISENKAAIATSFGLYTAPYLIAATFRGVPSVAFLVGAALWHLVSTSFYRQGYLPGQFLKVSALGPSVVLLLLLPFLDLDLDPELASPDAELGETNVAGAPTAITHANPQVEWVDAHVRTAPDGNPFNNLSHPGNPSEPIGEMVAVDGYFRTVADGDPTNNISAQTAVPAPPEPGAGSAAPVPDVAPPSPGAMHPALDPSATSAAVAGGVTAVGREAARPTSDEANNHSSDRPAGRD